MQKYISFLVVKLQNYRIYKNAFKIIPGNFDSTEAKKF
jgi:hypothetical protein